MPMLPLPSNLGVFKRVASADPTAGNEFTLTVPAGKSWYVISLVVALVQGITQTPQPILVIDDGTTAVCQAIGSSAAQAVSTTCTYSWMAGGGFVSGQVGSGAGVISVGAIPEEMILSPGWRMRSNTIGIGANSDYGVASALVCELG